MECRFCERVISGGGGQPEDHAQHAEGCPGLVHGGNGRAPIGVRLEHAEARMDGLWGIAVPANASAAYLFGYNQGRKRREEHVAATAK